MRKAKTTCTAITGLCLLFLSLLITVSVAAQNVKVNGTVRSSENGDPVSGASIRNLQSGKLVVADDKGKYSIAAAVNDKLFISGIGYAADTVIIIKNKLVYDIQLVTKSNDDLEGVVVVGYGTMKRKDLTGSVGSVNMKDFEKAPVKSFDDALAGRVAGVVVQSGDGQPGSNANIIIRGAGSITQDQSPLYVVDGFPLEDANANSISPADIESMDILKDASATAIYGSRGANGVIVITTKSGKAGVPKLTYNGYYGIQASPRKFEMMNPYEFVKVIEGLGNATYNSIYFPGTTTVEDYKNIAPINMQDLVFKNGVNQNHDVAVRGGTNQTKYSLSFNANNQNGIIINTGFKRYQGRFKLDQKVNTKLNVGINVNYAYSALLGPTVAQTNFYASSNILYTVWGWRPVNPLSGAYSGIDLTNDFYDPLSDATGIQDYRVNPSISLRHMQNTTGTTTFVANAYAEYLFTPKLKLRINGSLTQPVISNTYFNDTLTQSGSKWNATGPNGGVSNRKNTMWLNENTLTYTTTFNKLHHFSAIANASFQINNYAYNGFSANQLPNPDLGIDGLDIAQKDNTTVSIYRSKNTLVSGVTRVNYDYNGKYYIQASLRADGSSKFATDKRWGYFPSTAVAWNFYKEKFLNGWSSVISNGKIRVGYGTAGNNRVSDFAYLPTLSLTSPAYSYSWNNNVGAYGASLSAPGNVNLKWETSIQTNIGLDMGFFKDRISLTMDLYERKVNDLILDADLPYSLGVANARGFKNIGKLTNKGLELSVNTVNIRNNKFRWSSQFNIAFNKNTINQLTEGQNVRLSGSGTFFNTTYSGISAYISRVGGPLGQMYGLIWDGVYQYSDFNQTSGGGYVLKSDIPDNSTGRANVKPGDIKYKDINGDGTITGADYTVIGSGLPKYTGGFSNDFSYGNFDLNVLWQWSVGNDVINANRYIFEGGIVTNPNVNQFAAYANRWTPDNPSNTMFRSGGYGNAAYSSRVIENGSYLKLRTVSLGYNVSPKLLKYLKINNIRAYASAQNIATITSYSGLDPESSSRQGNLTPGFDYAAYPHSFSVVFGLNITF